MCDCKSFSIVLKSLVFGGGGGGGGGGERRRKGMEMAGDLTSFSTVFQSYQYDGRVKMEGYV